IFGMNQDGTHPNINVSFNNLTIQNGDNNIASGDPSFAYTGGGVDVFLSGPSFVTTFTGCTIQNNKNEHSYGGGVNIDSDSSIGGTGANQGSVSFTNCTISGNQTVSSSASEVSSGGGLNLFSNNHNVTMTGCTISNNTTHGQYEGGGMCIRHSF